MRAAQITAPTTATSILLRNDSSNSSLPLSHSSIPGTIINRNLSRLPSKISEQFLPAIICRTWIDVSWGPICWEWWKSIACRSCGVCAKTLEPWRFVDVCKFWCCGRVSVSCCLVIYKARLVEIDLPSRRSLSICMLCHACWIGVSPKGKTV